MERQEPVGLIPSCKLRTYQKQSLAFMVNRERGENDDEWITSTQGGRLQTLTCVNGEIMSSKYNGNYFSFPHTNFVPFQFIIPGIKCGLLCDEVGMGKSLVAIALVLANPASNVKRLSDADWNLARCRDKSLAQLRLSKIKKNLVTFLPSSLRQKEGTKIVSRDCSDKFPDGYERVPCMVDRTEQDIRWSRDTNPLMKAVYLEWQKHCREVGEQNAKIANANGIISNISHKNFKKLLVTKRFPVKTTIITTTVTLVGQWYDEIRKWAPELVVKVFHSSFNKHPDRMTHDMDLRDVDILLGVSTTKIPEKWSKLTFHRVIADEIHQYKLPLAYTDKLWGITATPFERLAHISKLFGSASLLRSWSQLKRPNPILNHTDYGDAINTWMIRHTKNQMIAGTEALKLPPMPRRNITVTMTKAEKLAYLKVRNHRGIQNIGFGTMIQNVGHRNRKSNGLNPRSANSLDMKLHALRRSTNCRSKFQALEQDIKQLLVHQPGANILIFTRFSKSLDDLSSFRLASPVLSKMQLFQINGTVTPAVRQNAIREFQNDQNTKPKLLVVSYKTGQCGITLTAASRVYLLEPCLLQSDEVQAGGRISRLGQTKQISLVRLVCADTVDAGIDVMHAKLASGALKMSSDGKFPNCVHPLLLTQGSTSPPKPATHNSEYTAIWNALYKVPPMQGKFASNSQYAHLLAEYTEFVEHLHKM